MAGLIYLLDSNAIAELFRPQSPTSVQVFSAIDSGSMVILCQPVYYEVLRGLLRTIATRKLSIFHETLMPSFEWVELEESDWELAADLWADAAKRGRQLSDMDLLIAAVALRLDATLVSADSDFDALPVRREDWRQPR